MCYHSVPAGCVSPLQKKPAPAASSLGGIRWESFWGELLGRASAGKPTGEAPGESSWGKAPGPWSLVPDP